MPVINRIAAFAEDMTAWRRQLHENPELGFDCHETAAFVEARLREFGITEIHTGIAKTGIVALIRGKDAKEGVYTDNGPVIGLRADMDALPMIEETGLPYASKVEGKMHACGHDGHTSMLLGAAKYLNETRNFSGTVALIFQPAEEDGGGGGVMVEEGAMDRFGIQQVYGIHNAPGEPLGEFQTTPGPIMAAVDTFHINITGVGGHGAHPETTRDPVVAAVGIVQTIQTISSRNHYTLNDLVISVTQIHTGSAENIIPETAYINGTVRTFDKDVQAMVRQRMQEICDGMGPAYGVEAKLDYEVWYPATVNDAHKTAFAADVARDVVGDKNVLDDISRGMGAEDFSYMLEARPGAYLFLGAGDGAAVHNTKYDFNDEISPIGASFFARLVEVAQPL